LEAVRKRSNNKNAKKRRGGRDWGANSAVGPVKTSIEEEGTNGRKTAQKKLSV